MPGSSQIGACAAGRTPRARSTVAASSARAAGFEISVATNVMSASSCTQGLWDQALPMQDQTPSKRAVLIAGPTASGKSALALALAEELGGTIINADSMQVYRDLRIITARPTPAEEARVRHLLYGHVDAAESYSVGRWRVDAGAALAEAERAGRLPIVGGGTGLYLTSLSQ